ncbi:hypothetical protein [Lysinibacillus sp. FSL M8-0355]|uniref:hypothetical protein n=1 Tax=Lysinibacillus sp. FSL M8-0355 TaxID=2921719 RepID=UPI0030FCBA0B
MNEIQPLLIDLVQQFLNNLVVKAKITIDNVEYEKEIYHTSTKHGLRKYVKLSAERGLITKAALVDSNGRELYVKTMNYQKGTKGYVIVFPLQIEAKEVKVNG